MLYKHCCIFGTEYLIFVNYKIVNNKCLCFSKIKTKVMKSCLIFIVIQYNLSYLQSRQNDKFFKFKYKIKKNEIYNTNNYLEQY